MEANKATPIYVGIFTVLGVLVLFYLTVYATADEHVRGGRKVLVEFPEARGLRVGANVSYQGVRVGVVESIKLEESGDHLVAMVTLNVEAAVPVYRDSQIAVVSATLLGTMEVAIKGGTVGSALLDEGYVAQGKSAVNLEEAMEKLASGVESVRTLADNLNANQDDVFSRVKRIIDENEPQIKKSMDAFGNAGPKFEETMNEIRSLTERVSNGEGTLGKLFSTDSAMYDRFERISTDVDKITNQIASGEGTMGQIIFSEEGMADLRKALDDISAAFGDIREVLEENRADIQTAVANFKTVGPSIETAATNIRTITERIESGQGTVGKLINEPELYDEAKAAVAQVRETLEEAEEQTVLQSFFRIFTGGI